MKRNRKYNKNLVQEKLMNGVRHIVLLLGIGLLFAQGAPEEFSFNQSTLQAFYYFDSVTINGGPVESVDWVGAFKDDICVGAWQWDTAKCGGGICSVPVMGDDGWPESSGYMQAGDFPTFKIYDASENTYYEAIPSEEIPWNINNQATMELLIAEITIPGCTNPDDCNYDPLATDDDGSCSDEQFDECGVCGGDNYNCADSESECICSGCTDENACNYSTFAAIDNNSCYYEGNYDCDGNCVAEIDCAGECGGNASLDLCNVCGGDDSSCTDCAGIPNGENILDECGNCDSNTSNDCTQDCAGEWGGSLVKDECNVCGGDNSSCVDCSGTPNGDNVADNCGNCDNNPSNDCVQDCAGNWGGSAVYDICGTCGGTVEIESECECSNNLIMDCTGECGGSALDDECGVCGGNNSTCTDCADVPDGSAITNNCGDCVINGDATDVLCIEGCDDVWKNDGSHLANDECGVCGGNNSTCTDCADVPNGDAVYDNCGGECIAADPSADCSAYCDADSSNDCIQDCAGTWGGSAIDDECGICGSNGPEENYDCDGNCVGEVNCLGECDSPNGPNSPNFQCQNGNVVCNPADCNSLDTPVYLMPDEFGISKIFPNPFNPVTQIQYEITQYGLVSVIIFDIQGREVDQLLNSYQNPGHFTLNWNAGVNASGMYFVAMTMQSGNTTISRDMKKILYLK
ncbi:MAG: T9SS type A sorting domain-containing protein [Candidatus Marinimicrobia bacterium]|nr:T9SS type A sorting domain-containing protein [Candidatus Neomarinimicrobiota bacterium]